MTKTGRVYYSNKDREYFLELTRNLNFIANGNLNRTLDKMLIVSKYTKEKLTRFFEKNGVIHILVGNFSDKNSDWIFNQVSIFLNDLLKKMKIDDVRKISMIKKDLISHELDQFINYIEKAVELKVKFVRPDYDYIDKWLRVDYIGLSSESVGVISLLLDKENNLKFNTISKNENIDFKESVLTIAIEAIMTIIRGNMIGYPRWISIKLGFQKYRFLSFKKLENQFFLYCITEGNLEKLESLETALNPYLEDGVSIKFIGSLKPFNEIKNKIRDFIGTISERKFY